MSALDIREVSAKLSYSRIAYKIYVRVISIYDKPYALRSNPALRISGRYMLNLMGVLCAYVYTDPMGLSAVPKETGATLENRSVDKQAARTGSIPAHGSAHRPGKFILIPPKQQHKHFDVKCSNTGMYSMQPLHYDPLNDPSDKRPKLERAHSAAEKENLPLQRVGSQLRRQYSQQETSGIGGPTGVGGVRRMSSDMLGAGMETRSRVQQPIPPNPYYQPQHQHHQMQHSQQMSHAQGYAQAPGQSMLGGYGQSHPQQQQRQMAAQFGGDMSAPGGYYSHQQDQDQQFYQVCGTWHDSHLVIIRTTQSTMYFYPAERTRRPDATTSTPRPSASAAAICHTAISQQPAVSSTPTASASHRCSHDGRQPTSTAIRCVGRPNIVAWRQRCNASHARPAFRVVIADARPARRRRADGTASVDEQRGVPDAAAIVQQQRGGAAIDGRV